MRTRRIPVTLALLGRPEQRLRSICPPLWLMTRSLCSIEANLPQAAATTSAIDAIRPSIGMIGQLSESCPAAIPRTGYNHFKRAKPAKVGHVPKSFFRKVYIKHYYRGGLSDEENGFGRSKNPALGWVFCACCLVCTVAMLSRSRQLA